MLLVDRECVRRLLESPAPDATLVFVRGQCLVMPADEIDDGHRGLVVARRDELAAFLVRVGAVAEGAAEPPGLSEGHLDLLAHRLDNIARDLAD
jgi:hypothetical protein